MKKRYILFITLFAINTLHAQWIWQNSNESVDVLYNCFFTSADSGYAFTSFSFVKTTNGGTTWTYHTIPFLQQNINSIYFTDANTGYFTTEKGWIYKTSNGGNSWGYQVSGTNKNLYSVFFATKDTGYIVGDSGIILKTTNGGALWTIQTSGTSWPLVSVCFVNADTGYAAGGDGNWWGNGSVVLKTTNGGNSWTSLPTGTSYNFAKVFFVNVDTGFAIVDSGYSSRILKTTDGGNSWTIKNMCFGYDLFRSLSFPDADIGYVTNGYFLLKTSNGGDSWVIQSPESSEGYFYSVYFVNPDTGYAVGFSGPASYGAVIKTTNGGGFAVGSDELHPASGMFTISPNPASDKIIVETSEVTFPAVLSILNLNSQELIQETVDKTSTPIDISALPGGVYIVRLTGERSVQVGKVVKD